MNTQIEKTLARAKKQANEGNFVWPADALVLIAALEAVRQEAEAWEVIEAWRKRYDGDGDFDLRANARCKWVARIWRGSWSREFDDADRIVALTKVATWCRAELAK